MTTDQRTSDLRPIGDGPDGPDGPHVPIDVPPTTLPGAIGKRWKALGGLAWGTPSFELQPAGAGLWCQFTLKDGSLASIFSSANTAACVVTARINAAYVRVDRATGPLGFPTTDEQPTHDGVGRFQMFQGGLVAWHPTIGAFAVQGAINARYLALGGTRFGYPISDEGGTPDGRGRFNHFRNVQTGAELSIYWTPSTGAHEVFGFIRTHYAQLGWERSPLGYPTSGELATHDKVGRFATFEHGVIVWHPKTGAFATWGPINDCYARLGGSAYGYPTTDPTTAPDGKGQFVHLRHLDDGDERSIYWHPVTGAHEVHGLIRRRWAELGWERSFLGYPTSDEVVWNGAPGGRRSTFQRGVVSYDPTVGAYPSPMQWVQRIDAGGFSGQVEVTADDTGKVHFGGYVRSSPGAHFEYLVQSMLRSTDGMAVPFTAKGDLDGLTSSDKDRFSYDVANQLVAQHYAAFANGSLVVDHHHSNKLLATVGDVFQALVGWTAGAALVTPGTGLIIVGATELVSLAATGSLVPGARIVSGTMWLAGPTGMLFAIAADGLARLATKERPLSTAEYDLANLVFKGSLPKRTDIVVTDSIGGGRRPFTFPRFDGKMVLNLGDDYANPIGARSKSCTVDGQLLVHELTHVWQYTHDASAASYIGEAIWARVTEDYEPGDVLSEPWGHFGLEEQARIVDVWFRAFHDTSKGAATDFGLGTAAAQRDQAFRFIRDNIRLGRT